jgi:2-oxoglutarate ferredoxin oxidoreductase subunit beta
VGATFVARTVDRNIAHMEDTLKKAAAHKGAAFVEILQNCNIYNDLAWNVLYDRESKILHELRLEHGKPLLFGPSDNRRAVVLDGVRAKVVPAGEVPVDRLWVHDRTDIASALVLANFSSPQFPIPIGVLAQVEAPVYEDIVLQQEQRSVSERGQGDIAKLLVSGDTWTIR